MSDPLWFKDAVIYELHVRSFCDGNGDGVGDFKGLQGKLEYLQRLGVDALWLMPFYASPLLDDGYDVTDHRKVHPRYGTLADFKRFLAKAHALGLRVITELVLNHTSDRHPWFQRARKAQTGSKERGFYVWSDDPQLYRDARVILSDTESSNWTRDPVAKQHYWHRFAAHQPDLNFDSPAVRKEILAIVDHWMGLGVDGMRLDAVPYLFERDGTSCENLPETHAFLRELRAHVDKRHPGKVLLGEACQWPEDVVPYFGNGDELHMCLHFPLAPRLFEALARADRGPLAEVLAETPPIPNACQWATFLRNHDDLSLEIVSDEERVWMQERMAPDPRARSGLGIRRRLAPLLGGDPARIELATALLLALPGSPVLYYGDEIGIGDDPRLPDRHGLRTPMQWDGTANAGFSAAPAKKLAFPPVAAARWHFRRVNVAAQERVPGSLLEKTKALLRVRRTSQAFGRGSLRMIDSENAAIVAFLREYAEDKVLVVGNLSARSQSIALGIGDLAGLVAWDLLGESHWGPLGAGPFGFTLGPHGFFWLRLQSQEQAGRIQLTRFHRVDTAWLLAQDWFTSRHKTLRKIGVRCEIGATARFANVVWDCDYSDGSGDGWFVPAIYDESNVAAGDAGADPEYAKLVLSQIAGRRRDEFSRGETTSALRGALNVPAPKPVAGEQGHTTHAFGELLVLEIVRKFEPGESPGYELPRVLREKTGFAHVAPALGALRFRASDSGEDWATVAILHAQVPNVGDAWRVVLGQLAAVRASGPMASLHDAIEHAQGSAPLLERIGQRLGQMHVALASVRDDAAFAPEPLVPFRARALLQSLRERARRAWSRLPAGLAVPPLEAVLRHYEPLRKKRFRAELIRGHGDLRLGKVLVTPDRDAVFVGFGGRPGEPLAERRLKRCALRDVAGIVRSLHHAVAAAAAEGRAEPGADAKRLAAFAAWCEGWRASAVEVLLEAYFAATEGASFLPPERSDARELLGMFVLDAAVRELGDDLRRPPGNVEVPRAAIAELLEVAP